METYDKLDQLRKLRLSADIVIAGNEITTSDDIKIYKKNALAFAKKLRGVYVNKDTGEHILLSSGRRRGGIKEVLHHDSLETHHLQSLAAIPLIIQNAIYITTLDNEEQNSDIDSFDYYVAGLNIANTNYTVKAVIANDNNQKRYYDHKLTTIEKGKLLQSARSNKPSDHKEDPLFDCKDIRLFNILQIDQ